MTLNFCRWCLWPLIRRSDIEFTMDTFASLSKTNIWTLLLLSYDNLSFLWLFRFFKYQDSRYPKAVGVVLEHLPFFNAACQYLYVNLVCRFHCWLSSHKFCPVILIPHYSGSTLPLFWFHPSFVRVCLPAAYLVLQHPIAAFGELDWLDMLHATRPLLFGLQNNKTIQFIQVSLGISSAYFSL